LDFQSTSEEGSRKKKQKNMSYITACKCVLALLVKKLLSVGTVHKRRAQSKGEEVVQCGLGEREVI